MIRPFLMPQRWAEIRFLSYLSRDGGRGDCVVYVNIFWQFEFERERQRDREGNDGGETERHGNRYSHRERIGDRKRDKEREGRERKMKRQRKVVVTRIRFADRSTLFVNRFG